ncbi:MAG: copper homeostasis protein CutC [Cellulosilyticaceae bacterium]
MENYLLEICVDSVESALIAAQSGADRIELCSNLIIGGTTPSVELFKQVRKVSNVRVHALIRPRFGDFCYTDQEFQIIKNEVAHFNALGAEGVVIGILTPEGKLDLPRMKELIEVAEGMSVTLHRAFDVCVDPYEALEQAIELGIDTILTSGQHNSCVAGKDVISQLVQQAASRIDILVGAGVEASVIEMLHAHTSATSYHMSGKIEKESAMTYRKEGVNMGIDSLSEFVIWESSEAKIRAAKGVLEKICFQ